MYIEYEDYAYCLYDSEGSLIGAFASYEDALEAALEEQ